MCKFVIIGIGGWGCWGGSGWGGYSCGVYLVDVNGGGVVVFFFLFVVIFVGYKINFIMVGL